jgi:hypothetical protein
VDKETELYYNNYFDLFRTPGWAQFVEEFKQNANVINSVEHVKDAEELFFKKGQLTVLAMIINLEAYINQGFKDASSTDV